MSMKGAKREGDLDVAAGIRDSFIANINHALRTPLNGIVGMVELLSKSQMDEKQHLYTSVIRESTEILMLQLDNIVELTKIEAHEIESEPEMFRLNDILQDAMLPAIMSASKQGVGLHIEYVEGVAEIVLVDGVRLRKVLTNLLVTALKFTQGGELTLKVEKSPCPARDAASMRLQFSIVGSDVVGSALYNAMEKSIDARASDFLDFGEITVSLCTVYELLNVMGTKMDIRAGGHYEPPFRFDLQVQAVSGCPEESIYTQLAGKKVLVLGREIPAYDGLLQMMRLWGTECSVQIIQEGMLPPAFDAYDLVLCDIEAKIKHGIDDASNNVVWLGTHADRQGTSDMYLGLPVYPQELLAAIKIILFDEADSGKTRFNQDEKVSTVHEESPFRRVSARVLLVEDDFVSRMYAEELLEGFGCEVDVAENGDIALSKVKDGAAYDIIFMDCMMPVLDGYNAALQIRKNGYDEVPIIALTANVMEGDRRKCLDSGMTDYITKPLREADLYAALTQNLRYLL